MALLCTPCLAIRPDPGMSFCAAPVMLTYIVLVCFFHRGSSNLEERREKCEDLCGLGIIQQAFEIVGAEW